MRHRPLVVAINGILTPPSGVRWVDYFQAYCDAHDIPCDTREYMAGPFPIWNTFVRNRRQAASLARELLLYQGVATGMREISLVAHSNGCDIALRAARLLNARGIPIHRLVLLAAVTDPDVHNSGVLPAVENGLIGAAYAYCSLADPVLRIPICVKWPYRSLGITGWSLNQAPYQSSAIVTRQFRIFGHGDYFNGVNRVDIFDQIRKDIDLCLESSQQSPDVCGAGSAQSPAGSTPKSAG